MKGDIKVANIVNLQMAKARGSDLAGVASKFQPGGHYTRFDSEEFIKVNGLDRGRFKLGAGAQA
jgi:hypothetical protein